MRFGQWRVRRTGGVFILLVVLSIAAVTFASGLVRVVGLVVLVVAVISTMGAALSGGAGSAVRGLGPRDRYPPD